MVQAATGERPQRPERVGERIAMGDLATLDPGSGEAEDVLGFRPVAVAPPGTARLEREAEHTLRGWRSVSLCGEVLVHGFSRP